MSLFNNKYTFDNFEHKSSALHLKTSLKFSDELETFFLALLKWNFEWFLILFRCLRVWTKVRYLETMKNLSKMFGENIETVEQILQNYFNDNELQVRELTCEAGSKDGDNYMSLIKRIHVRYHRPENKGEWIKFVFEWHHTKVTSL